MKKMTKIGFLLGIAAILFCCSKDFSTGVGYENLSEDDKLWLNDDNNDGEADSLAKYAPECSLDIFKCIKIAKQRKEWGVP